MSDATLRPTRSLVLIAIVFIAAGLLHLLKPAPYIRIVPPWLPAPATLVMVSGVCEILGGLGVLLPATRVAAGWGLIALLVAVLPALPGFLAQVHAIDSTGLSPFLLGLYNYAWFVGFGLAFTVYLVLRKIAPNS